MKVSDNGHGRPETVSAKADRLLGQHRVIITGSREALVIGDGDTYRVSRPAKRWLCTCPGFRFHGAWRRCAHILAVLRALKDPSSQAPVARLADLLTECQPGR